VFAVLIALLLAVGWWFFFISPRNADIADARDSLEAAQAQEQRLRVQIAQLREIQADELLYLDAITELEKLIPERPLLDEFIEQIDALAADTNIELRSLAPAVPSPTAESELRLIQIAAQIEGEFFDVLGFLFGLNDMERLVRVDSVTVSSSVDEDGATTLTVTLEMKLFTLADLIPTPEEEPAPEDGAETGEDPAEGGETGGTDANTEAVGDPASVFPASGGS